MGNLATPQEIEEAMREYGDVDYAIEVFGCRKKYFYRMVQHNMFGLKDAVVTFWFSNRKWFSKEDLLRIGSVYKASRNTHNNDNTEG